MSRSSAETRTRILNAARSMFSSHGYSGTSLDDILNAAGITKGAFYHYFKSKEQVCLALLEEAEGIAQCRAGEIRLDQDASEQLRRWARDLSESEAGLLRDRMRLILRLMGDLHLFSAPLTDLIRRFWMEQLAELETLLKELPEFTVSGQNPKKAAMMILSALTGYLYLNECRISELSAEELLEEVFNLLLR